MATNQLKVFLMLFWDHFWKKWRMQDLKVVNYLGTALFCGKFNLVDTDQFSCEYLVWVLCYCSQTDVLFSHWVAALAHTRDAENARPIAGVKPEKWCNLDIFFAEFWCFGLAGCCPQATKCQKFSSSHFVFIKHEENTIWSHRSAKLYV